MVRKILALPDQETILRTKSAPVNMAEPSLAAELADMRETLLATKNGVGLAAVQVGILKRIFMLRKSFLREDLDPHSPFYNSSDEIITCINPKIVSQKGELREDEGCLSVPEKYRKLRRFRTIKLRFLDEQGITHYEKFKDLASRCVQQEMDHLDGILIIDHPAAADQGTEC